MDALILAFLLCLLLDQNDCSQRLVMSMGNASPTLPAPMLFLLVLCLAVSAGLIAAGSALIAHDLKPQPRLLFFAVCLIFGGGAMILPPRKPLASRSTAPIARLLVARLTDRASFGLAGVTVLTGQGTIAAAGAVLGGMAALVPAMLLGSCYGQALPLLIIARSGGAVLIVTGALCALSALCCNQIRLPQENGGKPREAVFRGTYCSPLTVPQKPVFSDNAASENALKK